MNPDSLGGLLALLAILIYAIDYKRKDAARRVKHAPDRSVHRGPGRSWVDHQAYVYRVTKHATRR